MSHKRKNKNHKLTFVVFGLVLLLCLIQLFISHRLAVAGEEVKKLEIKAAQIEKENVFLEEEISSMGSLSRIYQEAERLGFVRTSSVLYLTSQIPVALGTSPVPLNASGVSRGR